MKQCAVILNGNDVVKVSNLKRKYNKFVNNPDIKILEECDEDQLEEKYNYWCRTITPTETQKEDSVKFYYFKNIKTGYTITSIYPHLDNIPKLVKDEWIQFEK